MNNNQPLQHLNINNQPRPSEPRQPVSRPGRPCSPPAVSSPGGKQLWEFQLELRLFLASYKNFNWARIDHKDLRVIFNQATKLSVLSHITACISWYLLKPLSDVIKRSLSNTFLGEADGRPSLLYHANNYDDEWCYCTETWLVTS